MAMTTCKECKGQVSTTADTCPHCGAKVKKKASGCATLVVIAVGLWVIFLIAGTVGSGTSSPSSSTSSAPRDVTPLNLTPEAKKAQLERAEAERKAKPAKDLAEFTKAADEAEARLKENEQKLKKYYATKDQIAQATADLIKLAVIKGYYEESKVKAEKSLSNRADSLITKVARQQRMLYASASEEIFVKNGMNADVSATGANKEQLRIKYVLMSKTLVYRFQNEMKLQDQAKLFGFKKIVYSDGYDESWTVDLE